MSHPNIHRTIFWCDDLRIGIYCLSFTDAGCPFFSWESKLKKNDVFLNVIWFPLFTIIFVPLIAIMRKRLCTVYTFSCWSDLHHTFFGQHRQARSHVSITSFIFRAFQRCFIPSGFLRKLIDTATKTTKVGRNGGTLPDLILCVTPNIENIFCRTGRIDDKLVKPTISAKGYFENYPP